MNQIDIDERKNIALALAVQYASVALSDVLSEFPTPEVKNDILLEAFNYSYKYLCSKLNVPT